MKLTTILPAALFAAAAFLSLGAQAAADTDKAAEAKAPVAGTPAVKKMKPHSHVEVKTGVPQKDPEARADKPNAARDQSKHYHPRDAKT